MKFTHRRIAATLALLLVLPTAGFRECSPEKKKSVEENVTAGLDIAAHAVPAGIETVRAFRLAGHVSPDTSLKLARGAVDVNSAARRFTQAALDGADAKTLAELLQVVIDLAGNLERDGTLHIKNEGKRLIFDLLVIAGKNGMVVALSRLKGSGDVPVEFRLDEVTKQKLRDLLPVFDGNDRLLRDAIARLSQ